jgi:transcriptional regulator with XRE-family HTH domain/mannose-6-phosphate isomerase-like protein (cupin superfamily)
MVRTQLKVMNKDKPIAKLRERAGLTQSELADLIGVSENTIANWEKGGATKWIHNLKKLCKALKCSLGDLDPDIEQEVQQEIRRDLTHNILDTVNRYCTALFNNDKKSVITISSFAIQHDSLLSYWLNRADEIINQFQQNTKNQIDCEIVCNVLILQNLHTQLSYALLQSSITFERFCDLVQEFKLTRNFLFRYVSFNHKDFSRKLILQTSYLSVYVISWEPGQSSTMHHHGNFLDAIWVIEGEIEHWLLSPDESKKNKVPFEASSLGKRYSGESQIFSSGDWIFIDRLHAHQLENSSGKRLTTFHIRFGTPPDDDKWETPIGKDEPLLIWYQTEQYQLMPA